MDIVSSERNARHTVCEGETFRGICEVFRDGFEATLSAALDVLIFWRFLPCAERQFLADSLISAQAWPERRNYAVTTAKRSSARIHMTNYLDDDVPIEAPCPKCGHPQRIPIGRIRSATETGACPSCHVEIDNRDLAAALEQVNQDIEVLMRDLHIQRMLFAGREGNSPRTEARPGANGAKGA